MRGGLRRLLQWLALLLIVAAPALGATPAEDHRRALMAYHRGDVVAALLALRPAAQAGHAPSQSLLAFLLERADETADAARWYRAAAAQDDPEGHHGLAQLLMTGRGVAKDEKTALSHFSKAAALGHTPAIETMATVWLKGQLGTDARAEPQAALAAVQRAAQAGHLLSAEALAEAYRSGRFGLAPDEAQAVRWQQTAGQWRRERAAASAAKKGRS